MNTPRKTNPPVTTEHAHYWLEYYCGGYIDGTGCATLAEVQALHESWSDSVIMTRTVNDAPTAWEPIVDTKPTTPAPCTNEYCGPCSTGHGCAEHQTAPYGKHAYNAACYCLECERTKRTIVDSAKPAGDQRNAMTMDEIQERGAIEARLIALPIDFTGKIAGHLVARHGEDTWEIDTLDLCILEGLAGIVDTLYRTRK